MTFFLRVFQNNFGNKIPFQFSNWFWYKQYVCINNIFWQRDFKRKIGILKNNYFGGKKSLFETILFHIFFHNNSFTWLKIDILKRPEHCFDSKMICGNIKIKKNSITVSALIKFIYSEKATNLQYRFVLCSNGQIYGGDLAKFCGPFSLYELTLFSKINSMIIFIYNEEPRIRIELESWTSFVDLDLWYNLSQGNVFSGKANNL